MPSFHFQPSSGPPAVSHLRGRHATAHALLDSGDSMFTVIVARMLTTPVGGPSHQWLLRLIEQMAGGGLYTDAVDFYEVTRTGTRT